MDRRRSRYTDYRNGYRIVLVEFLSSSISIKTPLSLLPTTFPSFFYAPAFPPSLTFIRSKSSAFRIRRHVPKQRLLIEFRLCHSRSRAVLIIFLFRPLPAERVVIDFPRWSALREQSHSYDNYSLFESSRILREKKKQK